MKKLFILAILILTIAILIGCTTNKSTTCSNEKYTTENRIAFCDDLFCGFGNTTTNYLNDKNQLAFCKDLSENGNKALEGLKNLECLNELNLTNCEEIIQKDENYLDGYFENTPLTDISIFNNLNLKNLETLRIDASQITDLTPLLSLTELKHLYISTGEDTNLEPLTKIKFNSVTIGGNTIQNYTDLLKLNTYFLQVNYRNISNEECIRLRDNTTATNFYCKEVYKHGQEKSP